jgi:hypothetical protein
MAAPASRAESRGGHALEDLRDLQLALDVLSPSGELVMPVCSLCIRLQTGDCPNAKTRMPTGCAAYALDERDPPALENKVLGALKRP